MFDVDQKGLAKLLERRGKKFVVLELIQNALDEKGVRSVTVSLEPSSQCRGHYALRVEDDAPEGFHDLSHAYTLFAQSKKGGNPEQRGRFNLGEKLVIAVCRWAQIRTTKGTVTFADGERVHTDEFTPAGSQFSGTLRMTHAEAEEAIEAARSVLVAPGIALVVNGRAVDCRQPLKSVSLVLSTEIADDDGYLRKTKRMTSLAVYPVNGDEEAHLYEMGIPVVPIDCGWHVDIAQKVPLNFDRDNVTPAYARAVQTAVVNLMHGGMSSVDAVEPWVGEALASPDISIEAVRSVIAAKHGRASVAYDPSDPEGSKIAVTRGYEVVHGGSYSGPQWDNIRRAEVLKPAGQVTPSPKPFKAGGEPLKVIPRDEWTTDHHRFVHYVQTVSRFAIGKTVGVVLANDPGWGFQAAYGDDLIVNIHGRRWFERGALSQLECEAEIDELLIHELAHDRAKDHLSEDFHAECCRIGAALVAAARTRKI